MAFWIGIYPKPLFRIIEKPVNQIVAKVDPGFFSRPHQAQSILPSSLRMAAIQGHTASQGSK
jgi:hypothetical protein